MADGFVCSLTASARVSADGVAGRVLTARGTCGAIPTYSASVSDYNSSIAVGLANLEVCVGLGRMITLPSWKETVSGLAFLFSRWTKFD